MRIHRKSNASDTSSLGLKFIASESKQFLESMEKILHYEKDIVYYLEQLYGTRLVEKIARPIPLENKE